MVLRSASSGWKLRGDLRLVTDRGMAVVLASEIKRGLMWEPLREPRLMLCPDAEEEIICPKCKGLNTGIKWPGTGGCDVCEGEGVTPKVVEQLRMDLEEIEDELASTS